MASPFSLFRKYQKTMLAVVGVLAMLAFVFIPIFGDILQTRTDASGVVVETRYGDIHEYELQSLIARRQVSNEFFTRLLNYTLDAMQRSGQLNDANGQLNPQTYRLFAQIKQNELRNQGLLIRASERGVVQSMVAAERAKELGIRVSDDHINRLIARFTQDLVTSGEIMGIIEEMRSRTRVTPQQLFDIIRSELLAHNLNYVISMGTMVGGTPATRWDEFRRTRQTATVEVAAVPVADFTNDVAAPSEAQLREFFDAHKDDYQQPNSPEPGFRQPDRVKFEYFTAQFEAFYDPDAITEEEIATYYEENKSNYPYTGLAPEEPAEDPAEGDSEETPGEETGDEAPSEDEDSQPPGDSSDEAEPMTDSPEAEESTDDAESSDSVEDGQPGEESGETATESESGESSVEDGSDEASGDEQAAVDRVSRLLARVTASHRAGLSTTATLALTALMGQAEGEESPAEESPDGASTDAASDSDGASEDAGADAGATSETAATGESEVVSELDLTEPASAEVGLALRDLAAPYVLPTDINAGPNPQHDPLWRVSDTIREQLARQRAVEQIDEVLDSLRAQLNTYADRLIQYQVDSETDPSAVEPVKPDLDVMAAGHEGISAATTELISAEEFVEDVALADAYLIGPTGEATGTPYQAAYATQNRSLFTPRTARDSDDNRYLFWMVDEQDAYIPTFEEFREQVTLAWKTQRARELATAQAEELAAKARQPEFDSLGAALADQAGIEVLTPEPFTWLTTGDVPQMQRAQLRVTEIEGLEGAGNDFMRGVFNLESGSVGVVFNDPQSIAYVVQVTNYDPGAVLLRQQFLAASYQTYREAGDIERAEMGQRWGERLVADAAIEWKREPRAE